MPITRRHALAAGLTTLSGCHGVGVPSHGATDCPPGEGGARLGFIGDVMLGRGVNEDRADDPPAAVWGSTLTRLRSLDGLFINLECCLSDDGERRPGRTYYFRADPSWAVPALETAGSTFASLANNHVLDFGPVALRETLRQLSDADIAHAGAGTDLDAALTPAVVEVAGVTVGVIAFTDRSPSYAAGPGTPGTAYVRLDQRVPETRWVVGNAIRRAADADLDLLIASVHWGPNWVTTPSDRQRSFARWMVDRGVDLVHGHSAHVVQGVEAVDGGLILYDTGDFVDDYVVKRRLRNDLSFLFEVRFADGRLADLRLIPVKIANRAVNLADESGADWLRSRMRERSRMFNTTLERDGRDLVVPLDVC